MQHQVTTQVEIAAPPERVWAVLTQWDAYPDWNPFIRQISGAPAEGERLRLLLQLAHGRGVRLRSSLRTIDAPRELTWAGHLWMPGLLGMDQTFLLEARPNARSLLTQRIDFRGALVPLMWKSLKRTTRRGAMLMNAALKGKVENYGKENLGDA